MSPLTTENVIQEAQSEMQWQRTVELHEVFADTCCLKARTHLPVNDQCQYQQETVITFTEDLLWLCACVIMQKTEFCLVWLIAGVTCDNNISII